MRAVVTLCFDQTKNICKSDISLANSVDQWWYGRKGITTITVTPYLPLYAANWVKKQIDAELRSTKIEKWNAPEIEKSISKWTNQAINQLKLDWKQRVQSIMQKSEFYTRTYMEPNWESEWLRKDAHTILPYIEGRRWLFEHVEKRMKMVSITLFGVERGKLSMREYLPLLLQYLYLEEEIELTAGINLHQANGKLHLRCERCGSEDYGIYLHYCSSCDHEEPVCDTCYVMGTSKGCSLVISRPKPQNDRIYEPSFRNMYLTHIGTPLTWNGEL